MNFDKLAQSVRGGAASPSPSSSQRRWWSSGGISGPILGFSDIWQLLINTSTTIVTLLMVFLIQNTQNRDTDALQLKVDELLRVTEGARLALLNLEEIGAEHLARIKSGFVELGRKHKAGTELPAE